MKTKLAYVMMLALSISCNNESTAMSTIEARKSPEVLNFERSVKSLSNPENRATPEEIRHQKSLELSDRRKDILIPSALELIKSTGASDQEITNTTHGDRDKILTWAVKVYNDKISKTNSIPQN
ncbi:hypothetical protein [Chryseobacterium pennipullorum]|uniref:Uncharacterized protein n=1 Tax=Chryseobacterium pennipullorum TaxID=2258963 RepID=A0A3D9BAC4_9FLAO|nr:hypothetical protein [Chryseobacterium pennipullorum]REC50318.1 hypothetical protein DRF67_01965 [Chryseobacterium pennipullorum]